MISIILAIISQVFSIGGMYYLKKAAIQTKLNFQILIGIGLYIVSTIFFILALNLEKISIIYPFVSLTYIGSVFIGAYKFKEKINKGQVAGIILITLGIILIGVTK
jgi:multidrug transporter EmrE-like cation transporter